MAPVEHLHRLGKPCRALANFAMRLIGEERPLRLDLEPTEDPSPSAVDRRKVRGRIIGNERADPFTEIGDHVAGRHERSSGNELPPSTTIC